MFLSGDVGQIEVSLEELASLLVWVSSTLCIVPKSLNASCLSLIKLIDSSGKIDSFKFYETTSGSKLLKSLVPSIFGMKGAGSFFLSIASISMSANQGCPNISSTSFYYPSLSFLSFTNIWKSYKLLSYFWNQITGIFWNFDAVFIFRRPSDWSMLYQMVHLMFVLVVERWNSNYHLVNQNSKCPPVNRVVMTWSYNHFRWQVFRRAAKRVRFLLVILHNFG